MSWRLVAMNSLPPPAPPRPSLPLEIVDLAPLLAEAIRRLHGDESLAGMIAGG